MYTMGRIAKARSRAEADTADDITKVNPLDRVKSNFVIPCKLISQVADDPPLPTLTSSPAKDTSVTSTEVTHALHMGPIWDSIQSIAKTRSRAKAEEAEDPAQVNPLGRESPRPPPPLTYNVCVFNVCVLQRR